MAGGMPGKAPGAGSGEARTMSLEGSTLFLVPPEVDRDLAARRIAERFVSTTGGSGRGPAADRHPDVLTLEVEEGRAAIGIAQVRAAIRSLQFAPDIASRKVCLVPRAEMLTIPAANALLKALEEPPRDALFVLLAERLAAVLPTIASRLRIERVAAPSAKEASSLLAAAGVSAAVVEEIGRLDLSAAEIEAIVEAPGELEAVLARAEEAASLADGPLVDRMLEDPSALVRCAALDVVLRRVAEGGAALAVSTARAVSSRGRDEAMAWTEAACRAFARTLHACGGALASANAVVGCRAAIAAHRACDRYTPVEAVLMAFLLGIAGVAKGDDDG